MPKRYTILKAGALANLDTTTNGMVPCKVLRVYDEWADTGVSRKVAEVKVTATRGAYAKGDREIWATWRVVPRDAWRGRHICPYSVELG